VYRTPTTTGATWIGVIAQFAFPQLTFSLSPLRGYAISRTLSRIGSADGCRGQDPTDAPDWIGSPLQLGMADGRDYVTGTAVGAPLTVLVAAALGPFVGVAFYVLGLVRHRIWLRVRRIVTRMRGRPVRARTATPSFSVTECSVAAASGAATLMATAAAVVSQAAAAAAVLRAAEGAVDGTPSWYPAVSLVTAILSVLLPMAALHAAWVWGGATFIRSAPMLRVHTARVFRRGALRGDRKRTVEVGAVGEWVSEGHGPADAEGASQTTTTALRAAGEALYGDYRGGGHGYGYLVVAQFVTASQALQGIAQAAGEFVERGGGGDGGAWASCTVAAWTQLAVMALCTAVLLWTRPHRVRRNYYAELLPTAVQTGLCAGVAVLATRRWTPNATIAAWLGAAVDATSMLQPILSICLAALDGFS
jgi:hypothetical protein